ncbi:MAG TPA: YciI family protein [Candidatus Acidoferrum sp.]|nr:YciI family protein [Candidatus Acidoferrum sp.]
MQFLLLIYGVETNWAKMNPQEQESMSQEYGKFTQQIMDSGKFRGGAQLKPIASATTVRVRDGKRVTTDGPFAETKEQLGGFYLVDANDLDEAIAMAARIPGARSGSIEVRPIVVRDVRADSAKG